MIKKLAVILALMLALSGCAGKEKASEESASVQTQQSSSAESSSEAAQPPSGEVTYDALLAAPETDEKEFFATQDKLLKYEGSVALVKIPEKISGTVITQLGLHSFSNKTKAKGVVLSDSVKSLEHSAFRLNETVEIFIAGKGLETVNDSAFIGAKALREVYFNDGLKKIDGLALSECPNLQKVVIPGKTTELAEDFLSDSSLAVIYGHKDSTAQAYAKAHNLKFEEIK